MGIYDRVTLAPGTVALETAPSLGVRDIVRFVVRYWLTIAATMVVAVMVMLLYILQATPKYQASAQVLIDAKMPASLRESPLENPTALDSPQVDSQIMILRSEPIALLAVERLGLLSAPAPKAQAPTSWLGSWFGWKSTSSDARAKDEAATKRTGIAVIGSGLSVRRLGISHVLEVTFTATSPEAAASHANAVAEAYIRDQIITRAEAARQGSLWLEERINELARQMNRAAAAVAEFKARRDYRLQPHSDEATEGRSAPQSPSTGDRTAMTFEELEARANTFRRIYESYLQAYAESVQRQSFPVATARILSYATPPLNRSAPRAGLLLALACGFGLLVGIGLALVQVATSSGEA